METISELKNHLGYWLRQVSNHVSGAFARALLARQVSVAEWVVMRQVHERPEIMPAALAGELGLTRGAVSKIIDKLEARKWIMRATRAEDGRVQLLSLTRQGSRVVPELAAIADSNDEHFFACLSARERATLLALLRKITEAHAMRGVPVE